MEQASREWSWNISEGYFRLITECIRLFSNSKTTFGSLAQIIDERSASASQLHKNYRAEDLKKHLEIIPTDGELPLKITILESSYDAIDDSIPEIEKVLGDSVSFANAVSLLLFDLVVEENRTEFVTKFGLSMLDAKAYKGAAKRTDGKVVPIR